MTTYQAIDPFVERKCGHKHKTILAACECAERKGWHNYYIEKTDAEGLK